MSVITLVILGVAILCAGAGIGYWVGRSGLAGGNAKLEKVEGEFAEYRQSVNKHFSQTASHFQTIGEQYRELYEHMASGAKSLCASDDASQVLPFNETPAIESDRDVSSEAETVIEQPADFATIEEEQLADAPVDEPAEVSEEQDRVVEPPVEIEADADEDPAQRMYH